MTTQITMHTPEMSFQSQNRQSNLLFGGFIFLSLLIHSGLIIQFPELAPLKPGFTQTPTLNIELSQINNTSHSNRSIVKQVNSKKKATKTVHTENSPLISHSSSKETNTTVKKQPEPDNKYQLTETPGVNDLTESKPAVSAQDNLMYLKKIYKKIESNKYYPHLAKRRGMQDIVNVSFEILPSGSIINLNIESRFKPLRVAAKTAINESFPFDAIPESLNTPLKIQYAMAFSLQ